MYNLDCTPSTFIASMKRERIGYYWAAQKKYLTEKNIKAKFEVAEEYHIKK
jgi:hypothetical protein